MKYGKGIITGLVVLLCAFFSRSMLTLAEGDLNAEVIVLVDVSGTMKAYKEIVKGYAGFLDEFLSNTGRNATWKAFADPGYIESINIEQIESGEVEISTKGHEIAFNKQWTDQKGAFENAVNEIEQSSAKWKCIVMLSDAELDYDYNEYDSVKEERKAEEEARSQFVNMVDSFAERPEHKVILVHFGQKRELFDRCKRAVVLDGGEIPANGILEDGASERIQELLDAVFDETLEGAGFEKQELGVNSEVDPVEFTLGEDAYRMILYVRGSGFSSENLTVSIKSKEEGKVIEPYSHSLWANLGLFFLADVQKGQYEVTLPDTDGEWECSVKTWNRISDYDVKISIIQGEENVEKEDGVYCVDTNKFTLNVQVTPKQNGEKYEPNDMLEYLLVEYCIEPMETEDGAASECECGSIDKYDENTNSFQCEVDLEDIRNKGVGIWEGDYECRVRITQGGVIEYESNPVHIRGIDLSTSTPSVETECIYIDDQIDVKSEFGVPEDSKKYYIKLDGEYFVDISVPKGEIKNVVSYETGTLSFIKEGTYQVAVVSEDEEFVKEKKYDVRTKSWCQWFCDFIRRCLHFN